MRTCTPIKSNTDPIFVLGACAKSGVNSVALTGVLAALLLLLELLEPDVFVEPVVEPPEPLLDEFPPEPELFVVDAAVGGAGPNWR